MIRHRYSVALLKLGQHVRTRSFWRAWGHNFLRLNLALFISFKNLSLGQQCNVPIDLLVNRAIAPHTSQSTNTVRIQVI